MIASRHGYTPGVDYTASRAVLGALEQEGVEYAVFGAGAMNLLGLARFTEDLDLFVAPTAENIARLRRALRLVFDDPSIDEITADDLLGSPHRERGEGGHSLPHEARHGSAPGPGDAALLHERFRFDEEK